MSWRTVALGDVCKVIAGQSPEGKYYNNDGVGIPFYQGKKDFGKVYINPPSVWTTAITKEAIKDDILMSVRAPVGPVNISRENICIGRGLAAIRSSEKIDKSYLFNYLLSIEKDLIGSSGAVFNSINKGQIEKLEIPLPPLATQKKIVTKLDAIFAEIDKATTAAEANAKNAEALFQSYLSDIFHSENPNFISKRIDEIAEIFSGSGFPVNQQGLLNEEIPFYKVSDMNLVGNERHMISHNNSISRETAKQLGAKIIPAKSIIFPKIGGAIATNKKRILSVPSCVDNNVMAIYPDDKLVNPEFFFHLLSSIELSSFANEAALPSIKKSTVEKRLVKIPNSLREQERICYLIESLKENSHKLKDSYFKKLNNLSLLKQSILRQAFAGELVKE